MLQQAARQDELYMQNLCDAQETAAAELAAFKGNAASILANHKTEATAALAALTAEASTEKAKLQAQYQAQFQAQFDQELAAKKRYVVRCAT
jgi:F0F1-type ATP synthase membrane subunit b/b'